VSPIDVVKNIQSLIPLSAPSSSTFMPKKDETKDNGMKKKASCVSPNTKVSYIISLVDRLGKNTDALHSRLVLRTDLQALSTSLTRL
jgi:hypothetical protein